MGTCDVIALQAPECLRDAGAQIRPIRDGRRKKRIPPGDADGHLPGGMIMVCGLNSVITSGWHIRRCPPFQSHGFQKQI